MRLSCVALEPRLGHYQGRRDLQAKEALPQGPPKIGGPSKILLLLINVKCSILLLKAKEERKPNKVIEKTALVSLE